MEKKILEQVQKSIGESIVKELVGYNKPLSNLTNKVIEENSHALFTLINDEFAALLSSPGFEAELKEALNKKLARTLISRMGGDLEKRVNELHQNPETRAKILLAISKIVTGENHDQL